MAWVTTDNIRGKEGDRGPAGSIASASAESVSAHEPAAVIMTGTDAVKHAHFLVPRGLPGMNAVPADEGVAAYVAAVETATRAALNGSFLNYVLWDGSRYPTRVPGAVNVFIGPTDPGLAMSGSDLWTNPGTVTMSEVVAAMRNPSHPLYEATKATRLTEVQPLQILQGVNLIADFGAGQPNVVSATALAKGGNVGLRISGRIPDEWGSARLRFRWVHDSATGTDARLNIRYAVMGESGIEVSYTTTSDFTAQRMIPRSISVSGIAGGGGRLFSGAIVRLSDASTDTITGPIGITDAWLERTS